MQKKCSMCHEDKPLDSFCKDKTRSMGLCSRCEDCRRLYNRENRQRNKETFKNKDQRYYKKHRYKILKKRKKWYKKNKDKVSAHNAVKRALYSGELKRPEACERCKSEHRIEAAHTDYTKPLDVIWLCVTCHRRMDFGK